MLPPVSTQQTDLPAMPETLPLRHAATAVAPEPSTTVFSDSSRTRMPSAISSSLTVTISSTYFCTIGKVCAPGRATAIPSAIVVPLTVTILPASTLAFMLAMPSACTPTMCTLGLTAFSATAIPAMIPPPPIGTTNTSSVGA